MGYKKKTIYFKYQKHASLPQRKRRNTGSRYSQLIWSMKNAAALVGHATALVAMATMRTIRERLTAAGTAATKFIDEI